MRWLRPKSLTSLMLLGLAFIALPLLVAVVDAAIQINRLSQTSQDLVREGVQSARLSRSLIADIASLGRTVRLYQVLDKPEVLDGYRDTDQRLATIRTQIGSIRAKTQSGSIRALVRQVAMLPPLVNALQGLVAPEPPRPGRRSAGAKRAT